MATLSKVTKESIEKTRQLLLTHILGEDGDDRYGKKEAVKQLLGHLIAARDAGLSFDVIAKIFEEGGLKLSASTLRAYFFELKTEEELKAAAEEHAKAVRETRKSVERQMLDIHAEQGQQVALEQLFQREPTLYNAYGNGAAVPINGGVPPAPAPRSSRPKPTLVKPSAKPPLIRPKPTAAALERLESELRVGTGRRSDGGQPETVAAGPSPVSPGMQVKTDPGQGIDNHLDAIEERSLQTEERTSLEEDLVLKEDTRVFYKSGKPFNGFLSKKQIHLLRTTGVVVAPMTGRSSGDFVKMPSRL